MSLLDAFALPQASQYRARASQLEAEARIAADQDLAAEFRTLAAAYLRLSEYAELHETTHSPANRSRRAAEDFAKSSPRPSWEYPMMIYETPDPIHGDLVRLA
jgi:hypothetical protein